MSKAIDITKAIAAKSDQLNADDLLTGPRTIRIRDVVNAGGDQPVHVYFDGDDGKPWKPAKSALRVLAAVWGANAAKWIGMSLTIYNDETVTWAGVAVGGIRVSHMEGLSKSRTLMLTKTRGKKAGVTIEPLNLKTETRADKIRARLFEVAEGQDMAVADAWAKLSEDDKADIGEDLLTQLQQVEQAAQEHRETDPNAAVDDLNASLGED